MSDSETAVPRKPSLSDAQVVELVGRLYSLEVSEVQPMPSYRDQNFRVLVPEPQGSGDHTKSYVLKVLNAVDSQDADLAEAQTQVMMFLNQKGFPSSTPIPTTDGRIMSLETISCGQEYKTHIVRLLTYLPGTPLQKIPADPQTLYKVGRTLAQINKVLKEFQHPTLRSLQRDSFIWNVSNIDQLKKYLYAVRDDSDRQAVEQIIQQTMENVLPNTSNFRESVNHGDFSHTNVLVQPLLSSADRSNPGHRQQELDISGILDFGNMSCGYYVCDVAICIMYMMLENSDPMRVGGHVLTGFESVIPLSRQERDALYLLVLCRFSQSLVLAQYAVQLYPDNEEYLLTTSRTGWKLLHQLWQLGKEAVEKVWFETAESYLTL
ncbi:hydroxylysine kinase-like isoform X2 [Pristis pectinata]|nr:hydroxylysine kinase-like isoform X2 [Pristis pectinata]XP_051898311.1 hydroxylysine kinase-like isoform X2 [Pristis pectinata]